MVVSAARGNAGDLLVSLEKKVKVTVDDFIVDPLPWS